MDGPVSLGIHLSPNELGAALIQGDQLTRLEGIPLADVGQHVCWYRPQPGRLEFFSATDLLVVNPEQVTPNGVSPAEIIGRAVDSLGQQPGTAANQCAVAAPVAMQDLDRRHLVSLLRTQFDAVNLVDSTTAAICAFQSQLGTKSSLVAVIVSEDRALEIAVADIEPGRCDILAHASIEELSGRALNHWLLQLVFDRLSEDQRIQMAEADDGTLSHLLARLVKSRAMLGRIQEFNLPILQGGTVGQGVRLRQEDIATFFANHKARLAEAIGEMKSHIGDGRTIERILLVGDFGEFAVLAEQLEAELGPVEVAPFSMLADGAALAARGEMRPTGPVEQPAHVSLAQFLEQFGHPLLINSAPAHAASPEEAVQQLFNQVKLLLAENRDEDAREIVLRVKGWAERQWVALNDDEDGLVRRGETDDGFLKAAEPESIVPVPSSTGSRRANRFLEDAEKYLAEGRVLEAVGYSHRANKAALEDHNVMLAMLDIHRRAAAMLSGPDNFDAAVTQLRCALQHRQGDEATCQALADRLVEQGLHLESQHQVDEALNLLNDASVLVDDDSKIMDHIDRLESQLESQ